MNIKNIKHKLHKLSYLLVTLPLAGGVASGVLSSCSDWSDHYEDGNGVTGSNTTLWEEIQNDPQLSDFAEVLSAIRITRQNKATTTSYAENLMGGRAYTLLAPVNGTFDKNALIQQAMMSNSGDSAVEKSFAMNHILNSPYSIGGTKDGQKLLLLNKKYAVFSGNKVNNINIRQSNIHCKNGIMHILEEPLPYSYNIYEALTNLPQFKDAAGAVLKKYNIQEFDEAATKAGNTEIGQEEGLTIYADSVMREVNKMVDALARLKDIDSVYYVTVPSAEGWNKAWQEAKDAFKYPAPVVEKADSLQEYYAYRALMDDAIYSMTTVNGKQNDSIVSVKYNSKNWDFDPRLHVFQKPYEAGGVLNGAEKVIDCANGKIFQMKEWSLDATKTYHKFIEVEGESYESYRLSLPDSKFTVDPVKYTPKYEVTTAGGDSISKGRFIILSPNALYSTNNWNTTIRIPNTLSATYDVKIVLLPVSVKSSSEKARPVKFKAILNWIDENGNNVSEKINKEFQSDPYKVDTITIKEDWELPACSYNMTNNGIGLTLETTVGGRETGKFTRNMYLDAIVLTPKPRKK